MFPGEPLNSATLPVDFFPGSMFPLFMMVDFNKMHCSDIPSRKSRKVLALVTEDNMRHLHSKCSLDLEKALTNFILNLVV